MDIAVTVTDSIEKDGGGKAGIPYFEAKINVQESKSTANESRIRFSIPICFPMG
jgi:hypothetical protein